MLAPPLRYSRKQREAVLRERKHLGPLLRQLYLDDGVTLEALAERLGVTLGTARVWLARYGLRRRD